jgi:hypothetical protein
VRANGWILAGFFVFDALRSTVQHVLRGHRDGSNPSSQKQQHPDQHLPPPLHPVLAWLLCGVLCCITVAPFVLQQYQLAAQFCSSPLVVDPKPAYCTASSSLLPSVYAHVQRKYWFVFPPEPLHIIAPLCSCRSIPFGVNTILSFSSLCAFALLLVTTGSGTSDFSATTN